MLREQNPSCVSAFKRQSFSGNSFLHSPFQINEIRRLKKVSLSGGELACMGHYRTYPAGHVKHLVSNTLINLGARYAVYDICSLQSAVCTLQMSYTAQYVRKTGKSELFQCSRRLIAQAWEKRRRKKKSNISHVKQAYFIKSLYLISIP